MKIAYVVYPDFTALDLVGPYEVISRWPDAEVHFLAASLDPVRCDVGLTVIPSDTPETLPDPDLIVVPGSGNPVPVMSDQVLINWLRSAAPGCKWTASVCTGAGLYAAAGLLEGKKTTTHWGFRDNLKAMGVEVVGDRVVWQGNHIPQPPFDTGSPDKADASTLRLALRVLLGDRPFAMAARLNRQSTAARFNPRGGRSPGCEWTGKHRRLDLPAARISQGATCRSGGAVSGRPACPAAVPCRPMRAG